MRLVLTTILTCLILVCPFVCGAAEDGHSSHRDHATQGTPDDSTPVHCPEDGDSCVCRGAVQSSDVKVPHSDAVGLPHFLHAHAAGLAHSLSHWHAHLTSDGHPAGLAGWGDSGAVRALLQNFRC